MSDRFPGLVVLYGGIFRHAYSLNPVNCGEVLHTYCSLNFRVPLRCLMSFVYTTVRYWLSPRKSSTFTTPTEVSVRVFMCLYSCYEPAWLKCVNDSLGWKSFKCPCSSREQPGHVHMSLQMALLCITVNVQYHICSNKETKWSSYLSSMGDWVLNIYSFSQHIFTVPRVVSGTMLVCVLLWPVVVLYFISSTYSTFTTQRRWAAMC